MISPPPELSSTITTNGNGSKPAPKTQTTTHAPSLIDIRAEQLALGSALCGAEHDGPRRLAQLLRPEDYYRLDHQHLHKAITALYTAGEPILPYTINRWLSSQKIADFPLGYALQLEIEAPSDLYLSHFAGIVKELAVERRIRAKMASGATVDEISAYIETQKAELYAHRASPNFRTWQQAVKDTWTTLEYYDKLAAGGPSPYRWPWVSWNQSIDPLDPGVLVLLAGATGVGKTIYLECLADFWAQQGLQVLFAHFELGPKVMDLRRTARHSGVSVASQKSGRRSDAENAAIMEACNRISSWAGDIHYTHTPGWSADQLCREAEVYAHNGQCDILIIDYLSKCSPSSRQMKTYGVENTPRQTDDIETIKNFAERLQVRVVTADQLNKDGRETSFDKLRSEDVEGSGQKTARVNVVAVWEEM